MPALRISVHEVETENGQFLCMSAGEFTGVFAPLPANEEEKRELMDSMKLQVQDRADYYLNLPDDAELSEEHDITLAEIKESIWANVVRHEPEIEHKTYGEAVEADSEAGLKAVITGVGEVETSV